MANRGPNSAARLEVLFLLRGPSPPRRLPLAVPSPFDRYYVNYE
jgi:hypothetical protein